MSIQVVAWALRVTGIGDPVAKLVLIGLASHANDDGTAAWPTNAKLAEYADVSTRTVIRKIQVLQDKGLIRPGDQELVSHYRPDRRPRVWDIDMLERGDNVTPRKAERGDNVTPREEPRGDSGDTNGVTAVSYITSLEPSYTESSLRSDSAQPTAQTLVAEWIDHCNGTKPPSRVIGQVAKEISIMLNEGIPYADVQSGVIQWHRRGLHPSTIPSVVHEMRTATSGGLMSRRQLETDAQFDRMLARARERDQAQAKEITE